VFSPRRREGHEELNTKKRLKEGKDRRSQKKDYGLFVKRFFYHRDKRENTEGHREKIKRMKE
jgi:hypothetical protein